MEEHGAEDGLRFPEAGLGQRPILKYYPEVREDHDDEGDGEPPGDEDARQPRALVQEAACAERVIVLRVRVPGRTSFVIVGATRSGEARVGLLPSEQRHAIWGARLPPGAARQRAREDALANAHVVALGAAEAFIAQHDDPRVVRAEGGRVVITDHPGGAPPDALDFLTLTGERRAALEQRGVEIARAIAADSVEARRTEIGKVLERSIQRIERRREAIRGDLDKISQADRIASQAQWLVAEAAKAPRGATKLVVTDWSTGEAVAMVVPLDPSKSAKDQVASMFKRAKRLRLGARIAEARLSQADTQLDAVVRARHALASGTTLVELESVLQDAKRAAPRDVTLPVGTTSGLAKTSKKTRTPYRTFFARSGRKLLVGKGAADNDALTLHVARPYDLWLHAKERTGAHVVAQLDRGQTCPSEDLVDAAHLAAHFSDARDEKIVDVQHAERRHLRKPKGSPPGLVVVDREKVLVLRVDADLLRALLEREEL